MRFWSKVALIWSSLDVPADFFRSAKTSLVATVWLAAMSSAFFTRFFWKGFVRAATLFELLAAVSVTAET